MYTIFYRFKYHLFDLTFLEKISRWLTNTQVKIKSEVCFILSISAFYSSLCVCMRVCARALVYANDQAEYTTCTYFLNGILLHV